MKEEKEQKKSVSEHLFNTIVSCDKTNTMIFKILFDLVLNLLIDVFVFMFIFCMHAIGLIPTSIAIVIIVFQMVSLLFSIYEIYKYKKIL